MTQTYCLLYQQLFYITDDQETLVIRDGIKGEWLKSLMLLGKLDPEFLLLRTLPVDPVHIGSSCVDGSEIQHKEHECHGLIVSPLKFICQSPTLSVTVFGDRAFRR